MVARKGAASNDPSADPRPVGHDAAVPSVRPEERFMADHTYAVTEIVGTSPDSVQQAIRNAVTRASKTLRNLDWFEATQIRGHIVDGEIGHFQVTVKVGFRMDEDEA